MRTCRTCNRNIDHLYKSSHYCEEHTLKVDLYKKDLKKRKNGINDKLITTYIEEIIKIVNLYDIKGIELGSLINIVDIWERIFTDHKTLDKYDGVTQIKMMINDFRTIKNDWENKTDFI